ncbi:hypothetical protein D516_2027 [Rhodobacter sp. AKP1]|nr:hypothetical protein D516_2027 [Rhodobacter sp. AKP1]
MLERGEFMTAGIRKRQSAVDGLLESGRKRWHDRVLLSCGPEGRRSLQPWPRKI